MRREVPSFRWGHGVAPEAVTVLLDLADACNDAEFAYAEARLREGRAVSVLEAGGRDIAPGPPHRAWVAKHLYSIAGEYAEDVLRLYLSAAAKLAVAAVTELNARLEERSVSLVDVDKIRGSHIYTDPEHVPPPVAVGHGPDRDDMLDAHARVMAAVRLGQHQLAGPDAEIVDPEHAHESQDATILEFGAQDLAEALHDYGGACMWALARLTRQPDQ
jgi:hypothetical protein